MRLAALALSFCVIAVLAEAGQDGKTMPATRILTPQRVVRKVPLVDGHDLQFKRMPAQGLSQRVAQIVQDEKGFMWFGTQDGLHRYDGYTLKVFRHDSQNAFAIL